MRKVGFFLLAIFLISCLEKASVKTGLEGKPLPAFNILLPDSISYFNTASIPAGKPVVLFYFSPVCPYCRAQMTEIVDDMNKLKDMQFYLVSSFPIHEIRHFYEEYKLGQYPNIVIGKDTADFVADYFEAFNVPYTAIFGKDKKLRKTFLGKIYSRQMIAAAEE
jgi:thiol-disulfide isomerase/thioredoxin